TRPRASPRTIPPSRSRAPAGRARGGAARALPGYPGPTCATRTRVRSRPADRRTAAGDGRPPPRSGRRPRLPCSPDAASGASARALSATIVAVEAAFGLGEQRAVVARVDGAVDDEIPALVADDPRSHTERGVRRTWTPIAQIQPARHDVATGREV